ncbi:MAG: hypothetical protein EAX96_04175 [Candidatus Lokiarchaeota archaeon]|nr:hypothetical protein [Candidatus Lokiarchaeota archaeon]
MSLTEQIFYLTIFILYCLVGILIINKAYKGKKSNVVYLGINIITNGIIYFLVFLSFSWLQYVLRDVGLIFALIFTKLTFYQDKKGPFLGFLIFTIVSGVIQSLFSIIGFFLITDISIIFLFLYIADVFFAITVMISSCWFAYAAFEAYNGIKSYDLEPFQKKRYLIFGVSGILIAFDGFLFFVFMPAMMNYILGLIIQFMIAGLIFIFIVLNYLVWVAPKFYRDFLNKGYVSSSGKEEELSEEELMKKLSAGDK